MLIDIFIYFILNYCSILVNIYFFKGTEKHIPNNAKFILSLKFLEASKFLTLLKYYI